MSDCAFQVLGHDVGEYTIASGKSVDDVVKKVNVLIAKGWLPVGGLCVTADSQTVAFLQGLIRSKFAGKKQL